MDIEETHNDAQLDEALYATAHKMMEAYCAVINAAKKCCQPIESEDFEAIVFKSFERAVLEAGYTEEAGYESPARTWVVYLKMKGL
jgi:hypothetical protein